MKNITVLGATGSIGTSTLDVIRRNPEEFRLYAAAAHSNVEKMVQVAREFRPDAIVMTDPKAADNLREIVSADGLKTHILSGDDALCAVAGSDEADGVMSAIVGAAALKPTLAAINSSRTVYLANKESLVMSGQIFVDTAKRCHACILPVDSEHNAIFQCLPECEQKRIGRCDLKGSGISRILLTGSGGPFRTRDINTFADITPEEAVKHPKWNMGRKISIDSATMMNKGLEFIEARWLFNALPEQITVVIHPESVVHSLVEYTDGAVVGELAEPDMRVPISRAMSWPNRVDSGAPKLDLFKVGSLTFAEPDFNRYPCLKLAIDLSSVSQSATTALNAANEVAVQAFLEKQIRFTDIYTVVARTAEKFVNHPGYDLESILDVDVRARSAAYNELVRL